VNYSKKIATAPFQLTSGDSTREKELGRTFAGMDFGYEKSHAIGFKRQLF